MAVYETIVRAIRLEKFWICLLIFLLPWQARWIIQPGIAAGAYWEYGTYSLYAFDILVVGLLIAAGLGERRRRQNRSKPWQLLVASVALLDIAVFFSVLQAGDTGLAWYSYGRFLLAIGWGWLVCTTTVSLRTLYRTLAASGFLQGVVAVWQISVQHVWASTLLGMAEQTPDRFGVSVIETGTERFLRAYGGLPHPNILAGFLALCFIAALAVAEEKRMSAAPSRYWLGSVRWILVAGILAGLVSTLSRSGLVAAAIGSLVYGGLRLWRKRTAWRTLLPVAALSAAIVVIMVLWLQPWLLARWQGTGRLEVRSLEERSAYAAVARTVLQDRWLAGTGLHNYGVYLQSHPVALPSLVLEPVHNSILLLWAESGITGLLAFGILWALAAAFAMQPGREAAGSMVMVLLVLLLFDHWLWSLAFGWYLLATVFALTVHSAQLHNK